jgi:hypothetical protein
MTIRQKEMTIMMAVAILFCGTVGFCEKFSQVWRPFEEGNRGHINYSIMLSGEDIASSGETFLFQMKFDGDEGDVVHNASTERYVIFLKKGVSCAVDSVGLVNHEGLNQCRSTLILEEVSRARWLTWEIPISWSVDPDKSCMRVSNLIETAGEEAKWYSPDGRYTLKILGLAEDTEEICKFQIESISKPPPVVGASTAAAPVMPTVCGDSNSDASLGNIGFSSSNVGDDLW